MTTIVLKDEILEKIKSDEVLRGIVADALGISISSMPRLLYGNDMKLTTAAVLKVLRDYLGVKQDKSLLSEIQISVIS
jgi:hypothetical protein